MKERGNRDKIVIASKVGVLYGVSLENRVGR